MDPELSAIRDTNVEGSVLENGTIRDINLQRGGFNTWIPNRPRYRHQPWKVQHPIPEPSAIQALSVEGSHLDTEPSAISTSSMEGSALDIEPSAISTFSVDGSTSDTRTIRDTGH